MKCVFEASNGLGAHMVKNLLENEGIDARIEGEHLQGGVGELQAMGIVRVMVHESDYAKAREIIDQWESQQSEVVSIKPKKSPGTKKDSSTVRGFIYGAVVTAAIAILIFNIPVEETTKAVDFNGDGIPDEKLVYKAGRPAETWQDRNFDGKHDIVYIYGFSGRIEYSKDDNNFDGTFETRTTYDDMGYVKISRIDANQNGKTDLQYIFKNGVVTIGEYIDEKTGKVRRREYYKLEKLVSSEYDSNGDGKFDSFTRYDKYGEKEQ